jgi:alkylhydroperoxidase family enzyme
VERIAQNHVPDAAYEALREHFTEVEIVELSLSISLANLRTGWPGDSGGYRP